MESKLQCEPRNEWIKKGIIVLLVCFMAGAFLSFVQAPFTGDIEVFIAAENQVKYKETSGLKAVFEAWELKGIANRMLMYLLYRTALLFFPYGEIAAFELAVKFEYAVLMLVFTLLTSSLLSDTRQGRFAVFFVEFAAVFCTYTASQLQAEMTCVVLSIFIFALFVKGSRRHVILAGILGGTLFFFKSILILLFFISVCGAHLYHKGHRKNLLLGTGVFILTELFLTAAIRIYYPQEFRDMAAAALFQTTLLSPDSKLGLQTIMNSFQNGLVQAVIGIPFLLAGFCASIVIAVHYCRQKSWHHFSLLILTFLLAADMIVVSNRYFLYHYYLLTLPCFIALVVLMKTVKIDSFLLCFSGTVAVICVFVCWCMKDGLKQAAFLNSSTVLLIIVHVLLLAFLAGLLQAGGMLRRFSIFCVLTVCCFLYLNYSSYIGPKYLNERRLMKQSEAACKDVFPDDFGNEPVLFLDSGAIPFYVDAPSYSRYFFNLPMQRWCPGDDWELQRQEYEKLMSYDGKYIVYSDWFGLEKYPELSYKIESEYEKIPDSGIWAYSSDWEFFRLSSIKSIEELHQSDANYILVKKA